MLNTMLDRFAEQSPITVMARILMERVFNPDQMDAWFDQTAKEQYTKDLLFSSVFDITSQVVCGKRPSLSAAYQASREEIGVSLTSVYNKLNGIEPQTSAELVRYASQRISPVIQMLAGKPETPLAGYRIKLLDGNCHEKTEHRIQELRSLAAGPLPGKSLVVYDPVMRIPVDVFPCEDGHAQERSLLHAVLLTVTAEDAWIADRNFCTTEFTCEIDGRGACFVIREHKKYPGKPLDEELQVGTCQSGVLFEQRVSVVNHSGKEHEFRRIRLRLKKQTRDGQWEIAIITNLPAAAADAKKIAELYQGRWSIETAFQELTTFLNSEIKTLGYPRAALFAFCVALVAYMILSVIKAALDSVHGKGTSAALSGYYMADEISATYRGMGIAIPDEDWLVFRQIANSKLVMKLKELAANVNLRAFRKHPRGPKKPSPKRISSKRHPHVSTARILARRKK